MLLPYARFDVAAQKRIILAFRLQTVLVIMALLAFSDSGLLLNSGAFKMVALYVLSNFLLIAVPARLFRSPTVTGTMLVADVVFVSACIYVSGNATGDLYLLYFLAIFMAALSRDLRTTIVAALVVSAVYLWVSSSSLSGSQILSSGFLLRVPLFFVTAFFVGFLANQARQREIEQNRAKEITVGLEQELEKSRQGQEQALGDYNELLFHHQNIMSSIRSGICVVDSHGAVTIFNREAERITGLSAQEAAGRPVARFAVLKPLAPFLARAYTLGQLSSSREGVLIADDGRVIEIGFSTTPLRNRHGVITGAIATFRDLLEIKQLREQIQRSEQMAFLGEMTSSLAKEILEPLQSINTFAKLQCDKTNPADRFHQFAEAIVNETKRIDGVVSQTLNFVNQDAPLESVDLNEIIQSSVEGLHDKLGERFVSVALDLDPLLPIVMGNPLRLQRVFSHLIDNGLQAIDEDGGLRISTCARDETVVARFTDNGPGVPHELREKIFQPFFTTKPGGTGLGLAVAQKIINDHGGSIWLINVPEQGAVFEVRLPAHSATEQGREYLELLGARSSTGEESP